jgi:hypothetical protein
VSNSPRRRFLRSLLRSAAIAFLLSLEAGLPSVAQSTQDLPQPPAPASKPSAKQESSSVPTPPPPQKPPALVDPAGPAVSLQTSEALFDVAVALNACGYDDELATSDPLRSRVRDQVNQALQDSAPARDVRDQMCNFISQHQLSDSGHGLAQYVSLALYLTPPPDLSPSVELTEMPPDATQVVGLLPLLKSFSNLIQLHTVWISDRQAYDDEVNRLHDPLTRMILETNIYLKMPTSTYENRRFLVVLEPLLAPSQTNARVYGTDYVVVTAPVNGTLRLREVRHTYLHYEIEPLLYARASAMDRFLPFLKVVRDAPLDFTYKSDIVALVIECMIRAVEARTMDTGVPAYTAPADIRRSDLERVDRERTAYQQKVAAIRQQSVTVSMAQGYVLTQYLYNQLAGFERGPTSLKESIGEMVYGMDVGAEVGRVKHIEFASEGSSDIVRHSPRRISGLDLAELKLMKGDSPGATEIAQQVLTQHSVDPEAARANFILARATLTTNRMDDAQRYFQETVRISKDPRQLAWSHIYLGRIYDVQDEREKAVAEYKAAMTARDGQADTRLAAEKGIKQPFELPHHASSDDDDEKDAPAQQPASGAPAHP